MINKYKEVKTLCKTDARTVNRKTQHKIIASKSSFDKNCTIKM